MHAEIYQGPWAGFTVRWSYWFAMIKVVAITLFILFGLSLVTGIIDAPVPGLAGYRLSSINTNLYLTSRMLFSLARSGDAVLARLVPGDAFVFLFGLAIFGGLYVWAMIFLTAVRVRVSTGLSWLGFGLMLAIIATTWWVPGPRVTLLSGIPWLAILTAAWWLRRHRSLSVTP